MVFADAGARVPENTSFDPPRESGVSRIERNDAQFHVPSSAAACFLRTTRTAKRTAWKSNFRRSRILRDDVRIYMKAAYTQDKTQARDYSCDT